MSGLCFPYFWYADSNDSTHYQVKRLPEYHTHILSVISGCCCILALSYLSFCYPCVHFHIHQTVLTIALTKVELMKFSETRQDPLEIFFCTPSCRIVLIACIFYIFQSFGSIFEFTSLSVYIVFLWIFIYDIVKKIDSSWPNIISA